MNDDPSTITLARARVERLLAERDQVRDRARAAMNPTARQTYSCRILELVGEANSAIETFNDLAPAQADRLAYLDLGAELAALVPVAEA